LAVSRRVILVLVSAFVLAGPARAGEGLRCDLAPLGAATVGAAVDGRTVTLTDGRELRLAGLDVPQGFDATAALQGLIGGREVALARLGADRDRYGRLVAVVVRKGDPLDIGHSVQTALLGQGMARVAARVGDPGCARTLQAAESRSRQAGLGLWSRPDYVVRNALDPAAILALRGRFAAVEGKVASVRESGGTIYVNFSSRWSSDFTATVTKRQEKAFAGAGVPLKKLTSQHVRIRGIVEERAGPWIEASAPEQIEILERD
jgi:endonuclease YncB( thermonuclease family)